MLPQWAASLAAPVDPDTSPYFRVVEQGDGTATMGDGAGGEYAYMQATRPGGVAWIMEAAQGDRYARWWQDASGQVAGYNEQTYDGDKGFWAAGMAAAAIATYGAATSAAASSATTGALQYGTAAGLDAAVLTSSSGATLASSAAPTLAGGFAGLQSGFAGAGLASAAAAAPAVLPSGTTTAWGDPAVLTSSSGATLTSSAAPTVGGGFAGLQSGFAGAGLDLGGALTASAAAVPAVTAGAAPSWGQQLLTRIGYDATMTAVRGATQQPTKPAAPAALGQVQQGTAAPGSGMTTTIILGGALLAALLLIKARA